MVPSLLLPSSELSVSVKENRDRQGEKEQFKKNLAKVTGKSHRKTPEMNHFFHKVSSCMSAASLIKHPIKGVSLRILVIK